MRGDCGSPVGCGLHVPVRAFRHALSSVDDEAVEVGQVDFGAELFADTPPALEPVGIARAVGNAAPLVVVVCARRARRVALGGRAAAQTLSVAALAVRRARLARTFLRALCWRLGDRRITPPQISRQKVDTSLQYDSIVLTTDMVQSDSDVGIQTLQATPC